MRNILHQDTPQCANQTFFIPSERFCQSGSNIYFRSVTRCLLLFLRMVLGMVYFGVALAAEDLGGELYRDYILQALVEFPAFAVSVYMCNRFVNP